MNAADMLRQALADAPTAPVIADHPTHAPPPPGPWVADALCAQTDPEAFFPGKGGSVRDAKRICFRCPVRVECADYAITNSIEHGVWGGLAPEERQQLHDRKAPAA